MSPTAATELRPGPSTRLALGLAVPGGWLLQDLAVVSTAGRPQDALALLPASLLALAGGAAFGLLARWRPLVPAALAATAVWAALPRLLEARFAEIGAWLPRALFVLVAAYAVASLLGRVRIGRVRLGFLLGLLGAAFLAWLRECEQAPHVPLTVCAALALPLGVLLRPHLRALGEVLLVAITAWFIVPEAVEALATERPDLPPPTIPAPRAAPNLLLVVLDTVRADRLGCYGYEARPTTPNLDRWAAEHFTLYSSARATSPWTLPSHASLFTGLMPAEHGATHPGLHAQAIKAGTPTLARHLRELGYRTAGIFANNVYLRTRFNIDDGFERFDDRQAGMFGSYLPLAQLLGAAPRIGRLGYREGKQITDLAFEWLDGEERTGPFFLALNYMEAHTPNIPPPPYDRAFGEARPVDPLHPDSQFQGLLYDRELLHLDAELDRLLRGLEQRGLFERTAIVITSDHGEALGDHGFLLHGWALYEALVHVPLLVKPAGGRQVERVDTSLSGADVYRLALELVGVADPAPAAAAPEAAGLESGPVAEWYVAPDGISEFFLERYPDRDLTQELLAWVDGSRKVIVSTLGTVEVYDLERDPGELAPLELSEDERAALLKRAQDWWSAHEVEVPHPVAGTPEELERLRHLGYLGDDEGGG